MAKYIYNGKMSEMDFSFHHKYSPKKKRGAAPNFFVFVGFPILLTATAPHELGRLPRIGGRNQNPEIFNVWGETAKEVEICGEPLSQNQKKAKLST